MGLKMTKSVNDFLSSQGLLSNEVMVHAGVKGMKWGVRRTDTDGDGLVDGGGGGGVAEDILSADGGGDVDDLELETLGALADAAISNKKLSNMDRLLGNDKDDGFFEGTGRHAENFIIGFLGGKAQAVRNKRLVNTFLGGIFSKNG